MGSALDAGGVEVNRLEQMRLPSRAGLWLVLPPAGLLLVMLLAPLVRLTWAGLFGDPLPGQIDAGLWQPWQDDFLRWRVWWSLAQAAITCGLALLLGLPIAWVLARFEFAGRSLVLRLLMLPFVVPTLVAALGVLALWGPQGLISGWVGVNMQDSPWLLLYGNLFFNLCLVVRAGVEALEQVNARQVAAARSLGATPWRVFWRVEWPHSAPWLMASLCLVFLYCFSGFGLALILGGQHWATAEVEIYTLVAHELQLGQASVLALWMLLLTGAVTLVYMRLEMRLAAPAGITPLPRVPVLSLRHRLLLGAALLVLLLVCALPILAIVWRALSAGLEVWLNLWDEELQLALLNTLRFSGMALGLATLLGLCHALAARQWLLWRAAAMLPFVVSPVTVAFGLLLLYPGWAASLPLLVLAYALLAYPFVAKAVAGGLDSLPTHLLDASRSLGATPWRSFWRVTLPLLRPALRRGMAFAAATCLGEFAVTLFLSRPEWTTLTTLIYQRLSHPGARSLDEALAMACLLMGLALLLFVLIEWPSAQESSETRWQHA